MQQLAIKIALKKANESLNLAISKQAISLELVSACRCAQRQSECQLSQGRTGPDLLTQETTQHVNHSYLVHSLHSPLSSLLLSQTHKHTELLLESNIFILLLSPTMFSFHYKPSKPKSLVFLFGFNGNFYYSVYNILQIIVQVQNFVVLYIIIDVSANVLSKAKSRQ